MDSDNTPALPRYRYKVANFIVATLQSCYVQSCYVTNLLRFKLAMGQTCYGVKLATYKVATLPNRYKLATANLATQYNVTKLLQPKSCSVTKFNEIEFLP